jgi:integrase/recombinase XerD
MAPAGGRGFSATAYKPFLHHVIKNEPQRRRTVTLPQPRLRPEVLTAKQVQMILGTWNMRGYRSLSRAHRVA